MYKIMDKSILLLSRVYLSKFSLETLYISWVYIRVFIVGYEMEYEKSFFCKTWCFGESLATGISHFSCMLHTYNTSNKSPLVNQSRDPVARCSLMYTLDQFFTLSHTQSLHYSHLNTWFLIPELQSNLARNKTNT